MSKLLAEYIGLLLNERGYIRDLNHEKSKKKNKGFLQKIKGFIFGDAEADKIAESWGVPGFSPPHTYNYLVMAFWSCAGNPKDVVQVWATAAQNFGDRSVFGKTTQ